MRNFELIQEETKQLRFLHKKETSKNKAYRINAVILLGTGWTVKQVSEVLLLDEDTLSNYVKKYKEGGFSKLLETLHQGSKPLLCESQINLLIEELDTNIHLNTISVCDFVNSNFGVNYSRSGMTNLLHGIGFTYKKPKLVPASANEERKEEFLKFYQDFMANKPKNELVLFADGVHPQHNSMASYGWIRKGKIRALQSNTGRSRLNIHGAMNAETFETTIISSENNIDRYSTIALLQEFRSLVN